MPTDDDPKRVEEDSSVLSRTCREVRSRPDRFDDGLAFIAREFSEAGLRSVAQAHLEEIDRIYPDGRPPIASAYENDMEMAKRPLHRVRLIQDWAAKQDLSMADEDAQAVLLVAAWLFDAEPDSSVGLPALFDAWLTEHWNSEPSANRQERLESQREALRLVSNSLGVFPQLRARIAHCARLAWNRIDATDPVDDQAMEQYVTLDSASALLRKNKRTLQRWLDNGKLPPACITGGGGKASQWRWSRLKPALERESTMKLPGRFPDLRIR